MARAESRTSRRDALSLDIDGFGPRKDGMLPIRIRASLDGSAAHQVHRTAEDALEALLQFDPLEQPALGPRPNGGQQIHVAVLAEILTKRRAEHFQPGNPALAAEPSDGLHIECQLHFGSKSKRGSTALPAGFSARHPKSERRTARRVRINKNSPMPLSRCEPIKLVEADVRRLHVYSMAIRAS